MSQESRLKPLPQGSDVAMNVAIEALHLDLRGIAPATAEAAVRLLGPALARALRQPGEITLSHSSSAEEVASAIAQQLARRLGSLQP